MTFTLPANCTNLTACIKAIVDETLRENKKEDEDGYYDDSSNSYKYIVFVLVVYAVSFLSLMVKYFWRSHESKKFDNLYEEFVKRDSFRGKMEKDRNVLEKRQMTPAGMAAIGSLAAAAAAPALTSSTTIISEVRVEEVTSSNLQRSGVLISQSSSTADEDIIGEEDGKKAF